VDTKYWWKNVNGSDHLGDLAVEVATTFTELKADVCFFFFFGLIKRHAVKSFEEGEMWLHASLTSVHVGGNL